MTRYVMALDEGTTSARAVLVDEEHRIVAEARQAVVADFPRPSWVTVDPHHLWDAQRTAMAEVLAKAGATMDDVAAVGITTHRETCLLWDRGTSAPVYPFISWMSKQSDAIVKRWRSEGLDSEFRSRTGLFNDSFFSAPKLAWLLEEVPGVRERAERGELAFGTVDTWLLWNLTSGRSHLTDTSEASRTALMSLETLSWDDKLCAAVGVPDGLLPPVVASDAHFGEIDPAAIGLPGTRRVPVTAVMADQQAGMFGQACFAPGSTKNTFGTAGVLTANSGDRTDPIEGLTASVGWTIGDTTDYEAEGVVFHSGQTLQWLRDKLGLLAPEERSEAVAMTVPDSCGVYVVPAFVGICAPRWIREARAGIVGLTLEVDRAHVIRAGLEAMAYQTRDCVDALVAGGVPVPELRVDGGAAASDLLCQFQADILGVPVLRPEELERTALGVAHLAGMGVDRWQKQDLADRWEVERVFEPQISEARREELYAGWCTAVDSVCGSQA
ncbi:FGGY family carbohydrate kinase [Nocardioides marmoribigeumensis]|uniref:ATP:glycerol 3-phosphotransferase n=1 Tax=Nocardioides marmoribigeumensis TaxID=433649 RepID=A0ABU2BT58_9ACTN|nr:glycerol kinase GlpK [Nocardioides marmoribigeumensis]MDR7361810.1 glycerol kinase [Nocardioides marmoribigeumensis]